MSVKIYLPDSNDKEQQVLTAFSGGVESELCRLQDYTVKTAPDVAVVYGGYRVDVPYTAHIGKIAETQKLLGKRTLFINCGFYGEGYYSVGWDGLKRDGDYCNADSQRDRFINQNALIRDWNEGNNILIIGQEPLGPGMDEDHVEWLRQTVLKVQQLTDKPIVVRPHPKAVDHTPNFLGTYFSVVNSLHQDLCTAYAVVTYNSNVGVEAAIYGVPVIAMNERSMAWDVSDHYLEMINAPTEFDRRQWAYDIAYAQWTIDEMKSGKCWAYIGDGV